VNESIRANSVEDEREGERDQYTKYPLTQREKRSSSREKKRRCVWKEGMRERKSNDPTPIIIIHPHKQTRRGIDNIIKSERSIHTHKEDVHKSKTKTTKIKPQTKPHTHTQNVDTYS